MPKNTKGRIIRMPFVSGDIDVHMKNITLCGGMIRGHDRLTRVVWFWANNPPAFYRQFITTSSWAEAIDS